ncbi:MAG: 4-alpha-glucanotransferase [Mariprofundaceae bacterium]
MSPAHGSGAEWLDVRRAGILLHLRSLPGPFAHGVLGEDALAFMDAMRTGGFTVWQFLPTGPTHAHGSPYEALSSFAGDPALLDPRDPLVQGWLEADDLRHPAWLNKAADTFFLHAAKSRELAQAMDDWQEAQADWLDDWTLFAALKMAFGGRPWWQWPEPLRDRDPAALESARERLAGEIRRHAFAQWLFERHWQHLKHEAEARGILLFGDLPIYVAHDSADVWAHRELFTVNAIGLCEEVAGVPPDYFSPSGQRWGNPLYRWERHEAEGFAWWRARVRRHARMTHLMRIDHFRGLEACWAIPAESPDGVIGEWRKAPGDALLAALRKDLGGRLPFVAEDLGIITEDVVRLRESFGLPGMKILQFAFDGQPDNPYLPEHHEENSVVYTGTHDNDTTLGWWHSQDEATRARVRERLRLQDDSSMPDALIEAALASPARLAVIPMQDLLALGSEARLNTPGTIEGNWQWRMQAMPESEILARWRPTNARTGRIPG